MAVLVGYASSDEEDEAPPQVVKATEESHPRDAAKEESQSAPVGPPRPPREDEKPILGPAPQQAAPPGPSLPSAEEEFSATIDTSQAPGSPYSANRTIIHDLTLPSVPNFDIPPSPPGSPPPGASKKLEQFLELKKKGVHFNSKLENSNALRNPSLMDRLMGFMDIDEKSQYETTISADLWDPKAFPDSAFRRRLKHSQDRIAKEREAEKAGGNRSAVEFAPSTTTVGGSTSSTGGIARSEKRKGGKN